MRVCCWSGMTGGKVLVAPLMVMVAERRGRSWWSTERMVSPVRCWMVRESARALKTMVRWLRSKAVLVSYWF